MFCGCVCFFFLLSQRQYSKRSPLILWDQCTVRVDQCWSHCWYYSLCCGRNLINFGTLCSSPFPHRQTSPFIRDPFQKPPCFSFTTGRLVYKKINHWRFHLHEYVIEFSISSSILPKIPQMDIPIIIVGVCSLTTIIFQLERHVYIPSFN